MKNFKNVDQDTKEIFLLLVLPLLTVAILFIAFPALF